MTGNWERTMGRELKIHGIFFLMVSIFILSILTFSTAFADDLSDAYNKARSLIDRRDHSTHNNSTGDRDNSPNRTRERGSNTFNQYKFNKQKAIQALDKMREGNLARKWEREGRKKEEFDIAQEKLIEGLKDSKLPSDPGFGADTGTSTLPFKGSGNSKILPTWNAEEISNPQIYRIAVNLDKIKVPPLPTPISEAWYELLRPATENSEMILDGVDYGLLAWDIGGHIGKGASLSYTVTLAIGKTIIAGAEGGLIFMTKKTEIYESALKYLKNSKTSQQFAKLVWELKNKGVISKQSFYQVWALKEAGYISGAEYKELIEAAKTVADEKSSRELFWDSMLSREALAAMAKKACLEIGTALFQEGSTNLLSDLTRRQAIYDSIRLERNRARNMLKNIDKKTDVNYLATKYDLIGVIKQADQKISLLFHLEGVMPKIAAFKAGNDLYDEAEK